MKKIIAFCLITILMLSSGCIGWADSNSSIQSLEEPASQIPEEQPTKLTEPERLLPPDEPPIAGESQNRLLVWPGQIDLSSLSTNESFTKTINISNSNDFDANVSLKFINKQTISNISVSHTNLTIPANGNKDVTITGITPSSPNYSVELEVTNSLNSYVEKCRIFSEGTVFDPETQMPLNITPKEIQLGTLISNTAFEKTISIHNPNAKSAKLTLMFKDKVNFDDITVDKLLLTIPANGNGNVKISGKVPSAANYQATLEIANNLNNHIATCLILGGSSSISSNRPQNVKVTYDPNSVKYTITWDPMPGIDHYNIYTWNNNKWELWENVTRPEYVKYYITLEQAMELRVMITGVYSNGNNTDGTEAKWDGVVDGEVYEPIPKVKGLYADVIHCYPKSEREEFQVHWTSEPEADAYLVMINDGTILGVTRNDGYIHISFYNDPIESTFIVRSLKLKEGKTGYGTGGMKWYIERTPENQEKIMKEITDQYIQGESASAPVVASPREGTAIYQRASKKLTISWKEYSSFVDSYKVYVVENGISGLRRLVQHSDKLSYTHYGVNETDLNSPNIIRFEITPMAKCGARGATTRKLYGYTNDLTVDERPCPHTRKDYFAKNERIHIVTCLDCNHRYDESHYFGPDNVCYDCGYKKGFAIQY